MLFENFTLFQYFFYPELGSLVSLGVVALKGRAVSSPVVPGKPSCPFRGAAVHGWVLLYTVFSGLRILKVSHLTLAALIKDAAAPKYQPPSSSQLFLSNVLQPASDFSMTGENVVSPVCEGTVNRMPVGSHCWYEDVCSMTLTDKGDSLLSQSSSYMDLG